MGADQTDGVVAAHAAGHAAHPEVTLPLPRFREACDAVRGGSPPPEAHAADFYLAAACAAGDEAAWRTLHDGVLPRVRAFLLRRGAGPGEAEAVADALPGHLWARADGQGAAPRIALYRGDSALFTWVAVTAARLLGETRRRPGPALPPSHETPVATPAAPGPSPLDEVLGHEKAIRLEAALHEAWGTLTPRECLALLLRYRDGLSQVEIARLLGVGEPRVSRLLQAGIARLRAEVARRTAETPPGSDAADANVWRALENAVGRLPATSNGPTL